MIRPMSYAGAPIVGAALALTAPGTSEAGTTPAGPYTVALQTGDQVTVADPAGTRVSVKPGAGRAGMQFAVVRSGASVYVLPRDTMAQVGAGAVDRRQFDVTSLVRARYRGVRNCARTRDFVAVQQDFAGSDRVAQRAVAPSFTPRLAGFSSLVVPTTLPGKRLEHYQVGVGWTAELYVVE